MIHIALCFTDTSGDYYRHALVTAFSVLARASSPTTIHIVHDETLASDAVKACESLGASFPSGSIHLCPVTVPEEVAKLIPPKFGAGSLYRLLLQDILPDVDTILYLDCDVVCMDDVVKWFKIPLGQALFAGTARTKTDGPQHFLKWGISLGQYINSGVLLINLAGLRQRFPNFAAEALDRISLGDLRLPDQDVINILMAAQEGSIRLMPEAFNFRMASLDNLNLPFENYRGKILHYNGPKPWTTFFPAALAYWQIYGELFGAQEALTKMGKTRQHESAPLYSYLLRHESVYRWIKRLAAIEADGFGSFLRSRLTGKRR